MSDRRIFVCAVVGPTATGKTDLAVALAKRNGGEIISFDSMQIYRDAPIATAIPTEQERRGVPHHLLAFLSCDQSFSVAKYTRLAQQVIADVHARGNLPILVGGTGLYYSALLDHLHFTDQSDETTAAMREKLRRRLAEEGIEPLYRELETLDPAAAKAIHKNNHVRVLRALELYHATGRTMSEQVADSKRVPSPYEPCVIGLSYRDRSRLYRRIDQRVEAMIAAGLEQEVRALYARDPNGSLLQAIGVKEFLPLIEGKAALPDVIQVIQTETRRYAKRQLTWFRRDDRVHWLYRDDQPDESLPIEQAQEVLEQCRAEFERSDAKKER